MPHVHRKSFKMPMTQEPHKLRFFLDCQQKQTLPESLLQLDQYQESRRQELRRELHRFNGPALVAFNDAPFKKEDWESIQTIHQSGKAKNPHKVGKFGIGFNSVYHITGKWKKLIYYQIM